MVTSNNRIRDDDDNSNSNEDYKPIIIILIISTKMTCKVITEKSMIRIIRTILPIKI